MANGWELDEWLMGQQRAKRISVNEQIQIGTSSSKRRCARGRATRNLGYLIMHVTLLTFNLLVRKLISDRNWGTWSQPFCFAFFRVLDDGSRVVVRAINRQLIRECLKWIGIWLRARISGRVAAIEIRLVRRECFNWAVISGDACETANCVNVIELMTG